ncbi:MAG: hypothetical protein EOO11_00865 [Chitinophagaceae bacterium]|nr:MAG: hypothetical protein EOO11_00865 [Chitinophagaceae bacterium]
MRLLVLPLLLLVCGIRPTGSNDFATEEILDRLAAISDRLPASIHEAYGMQESLHPSLVLVDSLIRRAYPRIADKIGRRSAVLNSLAGYPVENTERYFAPANPAFADYFIRQWDRFDALERAVGPLMKTPLGLKDLYSKHGYLPVWDSLYRKRLPGLRRYRNGVLALVREELRYLKANAAMFGSTQEALRMQYVEAEVKLLQKLVLLQAKLRQAIVTDAIEKARFCKEHPAACATGSPD